MKEKDINIEEQEVTTDETAVDTHANDVAEATEEQERAEERTPLEVAQEQVAELKDKYLRQVAEFDNYRKRMTKERAELILNGSEKAVKELLPVLDDMERAIAAGQKTDDPQVLREGMELIYQKFWKIFEKLGVSVIDTEGADFDTDLHEAIALVPGMGDDKKGKIIDCTQKGYKLNDKVIRFAQVAVGQ